MRANFALLLPLLIACGSADDSPAPSASAEPVAPAPSADTSAAPVASAPPPAPAAPSASVDLPPVPPATVSVTGTVDGTAFTASDAIAMTSVDKGGALSASTVGVMLTDFGGACGLARKNANVAGTAITVSVVKVGNGPDTPPIAPGTFKVNRNTKLVGTQVVVELETDDANGKAIAKKKATSGTITFATIDAAHVVGKVGTTFEHGSIKGTFDVPICSGVK